MSGGRWGKISGLWSRTVAGLLAGIVLSVVLLAFAAPAHAYSIEEIQFLYLINDYRQANGRNPLQINQKLSNAAAVYSQIMATSPSFPGCTHYCGNTTPNSRISAQGYNINTATGENVAYGQNTAQWVFDAWKASPGHNDNMLDARFCAIGIDFYTAPGSPYGFYWTTDFGGICEGDPQPPRPDTTSPTVSFANLSDGGLVSGLLNLTANAGDNVGVTQVDFYIDSQLVGSSTVAPFTHEWNVSALNGPHTLQLVAHDAAGNTGNASIQVTVNNFTATQRYLFTWYDQSSAIWKDWVLMANPAGGQGTARAAVQVGKYNYNDSNIMVDSPAQTPQFPGIMGGPATVSSTEPLITSQRVLFKNSFNEIPGVLSTDLESTYYFTWYDSQRANFMNGDWILIGNMGAAAASVEVYIGDMTTPIETITVQPGEEVTPSYLELTDGPVKVTCTNGQPLLVSQRVIFKDSFSEVLGMPESKLSGEYFFTWYDSDPANFMRGNWILVGNMDTGDANVEIWIGGNKMSDPDNPDNDFFTIPEGQRVTPQFPNLTTGPVRVVCTNGKRIIASQRVLFRDSFEEVQGLTAADFSSELWFTWYDSKPVNGMGGNWVLVANPGAVTAHVEIFVGGTSMGTFDIPAGENVAPSFFDTMAGPVRVLSDVPVVATQRVIYLDSFNEIGGMRWAPS